MPDADRHIHQYGTLLQVDTRMELGTSGGALVNLRGELIGDHHIAGRPRGI